MPSLQKNTWQSEKNLVIALDKLYNGGESYSKNEAKKIVKYA